MDSIKLQLPVRVGAAVGQIDGRAFADSNQIVYKNLHQFRANLSKEGIDTSAMTDVMWGLVPLHRCHHVSCVTNSHTAKKSASTQNVDATGAPVQDVPLTTYRVRICKTCCGETGHIELGTYNDQESAMLVNDAFEILQGRFERLLVLRPEDQPFFHRLAVQRCDRSKGKELVGLLEVIAERRRQSAAAYSSSSSTVVSLESRKRASPASAGGHEVGSHKRHARLALSSSASVTSEESLNISTGNNTGNNTNTSTTLSTLATGGRSMSSPLHLLPQLDTPDDTSSMAESDLNPSSRGNEEEMVVDDPISAPSTTNLDAFNTLMAQAVQELETPSPAKTTHFNSSSNNSHRSALKAMDDAPSFQRHRSYTFSTVSEYFPAVSASHTSAIETLTWLASLDEREVDVARSLFELANPHQTTEDTNTPSPTPSDVNLNSTNTADEQNSSHNHRARRERRMRSNSVLDSGDALPSSVDHMEEEAEQGDDDDEMDMTSRRPRSDSYALLMLKQDTSYLNDNKDDLIPASFAANHNTSNSRTGSAKKQVMILTPRKESLGDEDEQKMIVHNHRPMSGLDPHKNSSYSTSDDSHIDFGVVDRLSLLTRSAGLLASPLRSNTVNPHGAQFQFNPLALSPLPAGYNNHHPPAAQHAARTDYDNAQQQHMLRRPRSQSMSAIDLPAHVSHNLTSLSAGNALAGGHIFATPNSLRGHMQDPNSLPILRVLHQSHTHLMLSAGFTQQLQPGYIGIYSPEERKTRIQRFLAKRQQRMWLKKVKYDVRKNFADSRVRIKGRFVKKEEEKAAFALTSSATGASAMGGGSAVTGAGANGVSTSARNKSTASSSASTASASSSHLHTPSTSASGSISGGGSGGRGRAHSGGGSGCRQTAPGSSSSSSSTGSHASHHATNTTHTITPTAGITGTSRSRAGSTLSLSAATISTPAGQGSRAGGAGPLKSGPVRGGPLKGAQRTSRRSTQKTHEMDEDDDVEEDEEEEEEEDEDV